MPESLPQVGPSLAIGPANYAGQAHSWARAVTAHTPYQAWSFTHGHGRPSGTFQYSADRFIGEPRLYTAPGRARHTEAAIRGATHVALDGFLPVYGWPKLGRVARDAQRLTRRGLHVALIAHGSDIRDPEHHRARNTHSYYDAASPDYLRQFTALSARNRRVARESGLPLFVSTPDLLWDLPEATWLPLAVDVAAWTTDEPVLTRERPVVLHLPSKRNPPTKGTHLVTPVLQRLAADGLIEYVEPEQVPHAQMPAVIRSADVIVDQITGDAYGTAGVEAMASGRLVLAGIHGTRAKMPEAPPIVDVDPDTLGDVVRDIAAHPDSYRTRAQAGPDFVRRWHDGTQSATRLRAFLETETV